MKTRIFVFILTLSLTSCGTKLPRDDSPLAGLTPDGWKEWIAPDASDYISWDAFKDAALQGLIERALDDSLDMESARLRLRSAEISLGAASASKLPNVSLSSGYSRSGDFEGGRSASSWSLSSGASYEVDIWGRVSDRVKLSAHGLEIAQISLQSARISLVSSIATAYFNIRALDRNLFLRKQSLEAAVSQREFTAARFKAGLAVMVDVDRQDILVADLEAGIEDLKSQRAQTENGLAVLLGVVPQTFMLAVNEADFPAVIRLSPGTPSEILRNRPDIKIAEISLASSHINVDLVRTNLYPSFNLSAGANVSSGSLGSLFKNILLPWSGAINTTLPLFDGGRRRAELKQAYLGHEQELISYKGTILNALQDVENVLSQQESIARQQESLKRQVAAQKRVSGEAKAKYKAGSISALDLLLDENALIAVQQQEVNVWLNGVLAYISMLRAFGVDPL